MVIAVRGATSAEEVTTAVGVLDRIFGEHEGWRGARDRNLETYLRDPGLLAIALDQGRVVGAAGSDGAGTVNVLAVTAAYRGQGIARRLLRLAEDTLRERGARTVGLGSVDDAVGFYLKCGYVPKLLVQFRPEIENRDGIIQELLTGRLRDRSVLRTEFQGMPQLWVQVEAVDLAFKAQIEAVANGVVAQYFMGKQL